MGRYVICHPTNNYRYIKLVAPGALQLTNDVREAEKFETREAAEEMAFVVAAKYPWCLGKLVIEQVGLEAVWPTW